VHEPETRSWWLDSATIVVCSQLRSYRLDLATGGFTTISGDSTWTFPLQKGGATLRMDRRVGREGWWVEGIEGDRKPGKRIAGPRAVLSPDMRWLLELGRLNEGSGKIEAISVPDGKRSYLPVTTPRGAWWGLTLGYGGKELILATREFHAQISIMDKPFTW